MRMLRRQQGVVLIMTLVMLVVLSIFAISTLKTSVLELKIGGAHHVAARNLSNAEASMRVFLNLARNNFSHDDNYTEAEVNTMFVNEFGGTLPEYLSDTAVTATEISCHDNCGLGTGNSCGNETLAVEFDVNAVSEDPILRGRAIAHQGIRAAVAGNSNGCL